MIINMLVSSDLYFIHCCHMVIVLNDSLVYSCQGSDSGYMTCWRLLEFSWAPFSFVLQIMTNCTWVLHVIKPNLFHDLYFVYVVEAFVTLY